MFSAAREGVRDILSRHVTVQITKRSAFSCARFCVDLQHDLMTHAHMQHQVFTRQIQAQSALPGEWKTRSVCGLTAQGLAVSRSPSVMNDGVFVGHDHILHTNGEHRCPSRRPTADHVVIVVLADQVTVFIQDKQIQTRFSMSGYHYKSRLACRYR